MVRGAGRVSFDVAIVLNDQCPAENQTGRAVRGPFVRPACSRNTHLMMLKRLHPRQYQRQPGANDMRF